jgi:SAM-dependent methyltransferase
MTRLPPPAVVTVAEMARTGLDALKRNIVPAPIALLDLINDFWAFHVAFTLAELHVPDALRHRARAADDVARELGVDADMLYRVLRAATMLGLCEERADRVFALKAIGLALCHDEEASFRDFLVYMGNYGTRFWRRLPDCVRTGKSAIELETGKKAFDYVNSDQTFFDDFNRAMTATSNIACDAFIAAYDLSFATRVVDIGGGHGRLLGGLLRQYPQLRGVLFEQPGVLAGAAPKLEALGVRERVELVGGDFFEAVPSGADCYIAKSIIHNWSDDEALAILSNIRGAMAPNARVLLFEAIVGGRNVASFAKFLDVQMIIDASGRERTVEEYRALFARAGLAMQRIIPTATPLAILEARAG